VVVWWRCLLRCDEMRIYLAILSMDASQRYCPCS
jgi:hypothetical protein